MVLFLSATGFAPAFADILGLNNFTNLVIASEDTCKISGVECSVAKIKYVQTGNVFYDAECTTNHMLKTKYENDVIQDVQTNFHGYCSKPSRSIKVAN